MYTYVHLGTILSPTRAWVKLTPGVPSPVG